jgi:hypothetical protein
MMEYLPVCRNYIWTRGKCNMLHIGRKIMLDIASGPAIVAIEMMLERSDGKSNF